MVPAMIKSGLLTSFFKKSFPTPQIQSNHNKKEIGFLAKEFMPPLVVYL